MRQTNCLPFVALLAAAPLFGCGDDAAGSRLGDASVDGGSFGVGDPGGQGDGGASTDPIVVPGGRTDGGIGPDGSILGGDDAAVACESYQTEEGFVFGVTADSTGVAETDVRAQSTDDEESADLFSSEPSGGHAPDDPGTNALELDEEALGLDAADELDAVSFGPYVPEPRILHFSLRKLGGIAGLEGTDVRKQWEDEVVPGDTYASTPHLDDDATDNMNTLEVDEISAGLEPHDTGDTQVDDLDALDFSQVPADGPIYFSVARNGDGEDGATLKVSRDGKVSVVLAAEDLGLKETDELDALVVLDLGGDGDFGDGDSVLFSVSTDSEGLDDTAVQRESRLGEAGGDVFVSTGDGTNQLYRDETDLGLLAFDDLDALEVTADRAEEIICGGCPDGILDVGEECEFAIPCANPFDDCLVDTCECVPEDGPPPYCGDGVLNHPEECEFASHCLGFGWFPVFCGANCECMWNPECGDGVLDPGEACDQGRVGGGVLCPNVADLCTPGCQCYPSGTVGCGDGVLDPASEECDPGPGGFPGGFTGPSVPCVDSGDTCTSDCTCRETPPDGICGDGVLEGFEQCELGIPCADTEQICNRCECRTEAQTCTPDGAIGQFEGCDPLAKPSGCPESQACNEVCACVNVASPACGDGVLSPGDEECDLVWGGQGQQIPVGCQEGDTCNPSTCECDPCAHADKSVNVIPLAGGVAPTCVLTHAVSPDACAAGHWHGSAIVIDLDTCGMKFKADPEPTVCGHGKDTDLEETPTTIPGACMCDLIAAAPCTGP